MPADAEGANDKRLDLALQRILARDVVRYVGEPVAFVVGESLAVAQAAAEVVGVDYEALPSVTAPDEAVADGAPILWPEFPNNVYFPFERGDRAAVDAAFAGASHVTEVELRNNRLAANPMEPRGCVGIFETDTHRYILHAATGKPHLLKRDIARGVLHIPADRIRVLTGDVGGGFGARTMSIRNTF